jgi:hypothetical protein
LNDSNARNSTVYMESREKRFAREETCPISKPAEDSTPEPSMQELGQEMNADAWNYLQGQINTARLQKEVETKCSFATDQRSDKTEDEE